MSYKKANLVLPHHLLSLIQHYIEGEYLYIPKKESTKKPWGTNTRTRERILARNREILTKRQSGFSVTDLSKAYFLSPKTVYKIISAAKKE